MRLWYWWFDDWFFVRIWWLYPVLLLGILTGTFVAEWRSGRRLLSRRLKRMTGSSAPIPPLR